MPGTAKDKRSFVMIGIPAGGFVMGTRPGHGEEDEFPQHEVWVDEFLMGRDLVTAAEWAVFLNAAGNPGRRYFEPSSQTTVVLVSGLYYPKKGCSGHPANGVNWYGASAYCQWLADRTGKPYRLPTEAEWEKAARGGLENRRYPWGDHAARGLAQFNQTWVDPKHTISPVGAYPPNRFGLNDLVGNLWEWCADWYDAGYYQTSPPTNPQGPESGATKVLRGGSWGSLDFQVRCGIRLGEFPGVSDSGIGFRLARTP